MASALAATLAAPLHELAGHGGTGVGSRRGSRIRVRGGPRPAFRVSRRAPRGRGARRARGGRDRERTPLASSVARPSPPSKRSRLAQRRSVSRRRGRARRWLGHGRGSRGSSTTSRRAPPRWTPTHPAPRRRWWRRHAGARRGHRRGRRTPGRARRARRRGDRAGLPRHVARIRLDGRDRVRRSGRIAGAVGTRRRLRTRRPRVGTRRRAGVRARRRTRIGVWRRSPVIGRLVGLRGRVGYSPGRWPVTGRGDVRQRCRDRTARRLDGDRSERRRGQTPSGTRSPNSACRTTGVAPRPASASTAAD